LSDEDAIESINYSETGNMVDLPKPFDRESTYWYIPSPLDLTTGVKMPIGRLCESSR